MSRYIHAEEVEAIPERNEDSGAEGYRIRHADGAVGWRSAEQFERTYIPISESGILRQYDRIGVDREIVAHCIEEKQVCTLGGSTTVVRVKLKNGMIIVDSASSRDAESYDAARGEKACMKRIEGRIWYALQFMLRFAES